MELEKLPKELLHIIFAFLPFEDLKSALLVNRHIHQVDISWYSTPLFSCYSGGNLPKPLDSFSTLAEPKQRRLYC